MAFKNFLIQDSYSIVRNVEYDHQAGIVKCNISIYASQEDSLMPDSIQALIQKGYMVSKPTDDQYVKISTTSEESITPEAGQRILINNPQNEDHGKVLWISQGSLMTETLALPANVLVQDSGDILHIAESEGLVIIEPSESELSWWDDYFSIDSLSEGGITLMGQIYKYLKERHVEFRDVEDC